MYVVWDMFKLSMTTLHNILETAETRGFSRPEHFVLDEGIAADPQMVVENRNWSLFTFDQAKERALFVELPEGTDLSQAAFAYLDQRKLAQRVLSVPFSELDGLAAQIPEAKTNVFVFSIGRCGSTLVGNILNQLDEVYCLSEPDAYSRLIMESFDASIRVNYTPEQVINLIRVTTRLLFRPPAGATTYAVKFRSQNLFQADLFQAAFPDAKFIFLYRDAISWTNSVFQMTQKFGQSTVLTDDLRTQIWSILSAASDAAYLKPYVDVTAENIPSEQTILPAWPFSMEEYSQQLARGIPYYSLRYNELNSDRVASLSALLEHCGLPTAEVATALEAFERDSQEGTHIAKSIEVERLNEKQKSTLREILSRHPSFANPDAIMPDIYNR